MSRLPSKCGGIENSFRYHQSVFATSARRGSPAPYHRGFKRWFRSRSACTLPGTMEGIHWRAVPPPSSRPGTSGSSDVTARIHQSDPLRDKVSFDPRPIPSIANSGADIACMRVSDSAATKAAVAEAATNSLRVMPVEVERIFLRKPIVWMTKPVQESPLRVLCPVDYHDRPSSRLRQPKKFRLPLKRVEHWNSRGHPSQTARKAASTGSPSMIPRSLS